MKNIAQSGILVSLALVLSVVESWFPLQAIVPVAGLKLGLANLVLMYALVSLDFKQTLVILICRVILSSIFAGSVTSFLFSLFGGLLAIIIMKILLKWHERYFSLMGISVCGAAFHHIGQIIAAMIVLKTYYVIAYLPVLLIFSIPMGLITGYTTTFVLYHLKKVQNSA